MSVGVHIVNLTMKSIVGNAVVNKEQATIKQMCAASSEIRVMEDASVPSSAGFPTVPDFIRAEAALGYKVAVINQTMIILYNG